MGEGCVLLVMGLGGFIFTYLEKKCVCVCVCVENQAFDGQD